MICRRLLSAGVILLLAGGLQAEMLPVVNPGFEDPYLGGNLPAEFNGDVPPTAFPVGDAPNGWGPFGAVGGGASIGVLNPGTEIDDGGTNYPLGAPEGDNVAITFFNDFAGGAEFGIEQTLAATLQANTVYTLLVEVGNIASGTATVQPYQGFGFFDLRGFPGYRIDLLAGELVIAQDINSLSPADGTFSTSMIQAIIGDTHTQLGEELTIRLVNLNTQDVNDPAVDLEVNFDNVRLDATVIPSPGSGLLALLGVGAMALVRSGRSKP